MWKREQQGAEKGRAKIIDESNSNKAEMTLNLSNKPGKTSDSYYSNGKNYKRTNESSRKGTSR